MVFCAQSAGLWAKKTTTIGARNHCNVAIVLKHPPLLISCSTRSGLAYLFFSHIFFSHSWSEPKRSKTEKVKLDTLCRELTYPIPADTLSRWFSELPVKEATMMRTGYKIPTELEFQSERALYNILEPRQFGPKCWVKQLSLDWLIDSDVFFVEFSCIYFLFRHDGGCVTWVGEYFAGITTWYLNGWRQLVMLRSEVSSSWLGRKGFPKIWRKQGKLRGLALQINKHSSGNGTFLKVRNITSILKWQMVHCDYQMDIKE